MVRFHLLPATPNATPTDPPFGNTPSSTDGCPEYPLPGKAGEVLPLVIHVYNRGSNSSTNISIQWVSGHIDMMPQVLVEVGAVPFFVLGERAGCLRE